MNVESMNFRSLLRFLHRSALMGGVKVPYRTIIWFLSTVFKEKGYHHLHPDSREIVGAATLSSITKDYVLKEDEHSVFFHQVCHRPWDAREVSSGINRYSRSSIHTQFQVLSRPSGNHLNFMRELVREVVDRLGLDPIHLTFHKDDWSSRLIGAYGYGFEARYCNVEIAQCTVFGRYLGLKISEVSECVFGIERLVYVCLNHEDRDPIMPSVIGCGRRDRYYRKVARGSATNFRTLKCKLRYLVLVLACDRFQGNRWVRFLEGIHIFNLICLDPLLDGIERLHYVKLLQVLFPSLR